MFAPIKSSQWLSMCQTLAEVAWNAARDAMPTTEDFRDLELPDIEWETVGDSIGSAAGEWTSSAPDAVGSKFDPIINWWNE